MKIYKKFSRNIEHRAKMLDKGLELLESGFNNCPDILEKQSLAVDWRGLIFSSKNKTVVDAIFMLDCAMMHSGMAELQKMKWK